MLKTITTDCPTYLEISLKNGEPTVVNGKEFNHDGVAQVLSYICQEVNVKSDEVIATAKVAANNNGAVKLKLFDGAVTAI